MDVLVLRKYYLFVIFASLLESLRTVIFFFLASLYWLCQLYSVLASQTMGYATRLRVRSISLPQYFPSISSQNNWANSVVFFPYDPFPFPFFFLFLRQKPNIHLLETEHLIYPVWVMCASSIWRIGGRNSQGARSVSTGGMQKECEAVVKDQSVHLCVESPGAFIWMPWLVDTQHAWCLDFRTVHTLFGGLCCFSFFLANSGFEYFKANSWT